MNLLQEVDEMLDVLLSGIRQILEDNLVGVYLRGSLATGDFIPETSDLDVLAVTERPVNDAEFAALAILHARLATLPNPYANCIEMAYIDRAALRHFKPGLRHPTLEQGEALAWSEHRNRWILERWIVLEHGVALLGPDPQTLIDPISSEDLRAAVRARLLDRGSWADQPDNPDWLLPRGHKAYVVETMCRALYTLAWGELASKQRGVAWAIETRSLSHGVPRSSDRGTGTLTMRLILPSCQRLCNLCVEPLWKARMWLEEGCAESCRVRLTCACSRRPELGPQLKRFGFRGQPDVLMRSGRG
jgi:predicted nucleotidyltransferase